MRLALLAGLTSALLMGSSLSAQGQPSDDLPASVPVSLDSGPCADPVSIDPAPLVPCQESQWSLSGEYLVWFLRQGHIPPLLTTSSYASLGRLGQPDTQVLYGDQSLQTRHDDRFVGTRLTFDWLNAEQTWGLEARAFFLERDSTHFKAVSNGSTLLAIPYYDARDGSSTSAIIAGPTAAGIRDGAFVGYSRIELFGEEGNVVIPLQTQGALRWGMLLGARFLQMRDRFDLTAAGHLLPERAILYGLDDHLRVHNGFYGGQVGLKSEYTLGRWLFNARGTVALGADDQLVRAYGDRIYHTPQARTVTPYGLLVEPSNAGKFRRTAVDMVSEVGVNMGYQLTHHVSLFAGYTFLYWNNPLRAGDQIDTTINPGAGTPPARPARPYKSEPFWAQGINLGLNLCW